MQLTLSDLLNSLGKYHLNFNRSVCTVGGFNLLTKKCFYLAMGLAGLLDERTQ